MSKYAKLIVAAIGAAAEAVVQLGLGGTVQEVATIVVAVATAVGVYAVPNAPTSTSTVPASTSTKTVA